MENYEKTIEVRWVDVDANRHMRHSAYYDFGAHVRMSYFHDNGFGIDELNQLKIGPVLFKEECSFIREVLPNEKLVVNVLRGEMSEDGSRWVLHHEFKNLKEEKIAHITVKGAWMDLEKRKLSQPPQGIVKRLRELTLGAEYNYQKNSKK